MASVAVSPERLSRMTMFLLGMVFGAILLSAGYGIALLVLDSDVPWLSPLMPYYVVAIILMNTALIMDVRDQQHTRFYRDVWESVVVMNLGITVSVAIWYAWHVYPV
jgi:hypothetical protein